MGTTWSDLVTVVERASEALDEARERLDAARGTPDEAAARAAVEAAEAALAEAEDEYAAYDGPRPWRLYCEADEAELELDSCTLADARREARDWVQDGSWDVDESTIWITVQVRDPRTDEIVGVVEVPIDPEEPPCARGRDEHDWVTPHEVVGGNEENPGIHACGAGVISSEVCLHCRRIRIEDSSEGRRVVSYARDREHTLGDRIANYIDEHEIVVCPELVSELLGIDAEELDDRVLRSAIREIADETEEELADRELEWVPVRRDSGGDATHGDRAPLEVLDAVRARADEIRERIGI